MSKKVFLTGGAGFIGSHTVEHVLKNTDWEILMLDRLTYAGDLGRLKDMEIMETEGHRVKHLYHDFRSPFLGRIFREIEKFDPDIIIHMGAETHVKNSLFEPMLFAETNVIGTINVLELAKRLDIERFLYVSTDEVYGPVEVGINHLEGESHRPSNPYSASKAGAEDFVYAYWKSYGVPVIITNTMNNFGERQDPEKFVPMVIGNILSGKSVKIHAAVDNLGKITDISSRCWLHARNHADGLLFVLEYGEIGERYNIVGEWAPVDHIATMIAESLGKKVVFDYVPFHQYSPGHDMHYGLEGNKLAKLGWEPKVDLQNSLEKVVKWSVDHQEWLKLYPLGGK